MARAWLAALAVVGWAAASWRPAFPDEAEPGRAYVHDFMRRYEVKQTPPAELAPILAALEARQPDDAIRLCNALLARDNAQFRNKAEASWLKSEAQRHLAEATYSEHGDYNEAIALLKPAADSGNLAADSKLTELLWRKLGGDANYASVNADPETLGRYLRIGAELGDTMSAVMLGASNVPSKLDEPEKTYWALIGLALAIGETVDYRRRMMAGVIKHAGPDGAAEAVKRYSLMPATTPAGPGATPGRGLVATVYADANLRRDYGFSYGRRGTEGMPSHPTPSVQEVFKTLQAAANVAGDIRLFLLVPGSRRFDDPAYVSAPREALSAAMSPSDTVFVRCGPLAHIAEIHHVDRAADRAYLSDGLWEFWQPSHNSCITHFELAPYTHGGFLAVVPFSELTAIVEAVATIRDRTEP